jgi:hypothetical protein
MFNAPLIFRQRTKQQRTNGKTPLKLPASGAPNSAWQLGSLGVRVCVPCLFAQHPSPSPAPKEARHQEITVRDQREPKGVFWGDAISSFHEFPRSLSISYQLSIITNFTFFSRLSDFLPSAKTPGLIYSHLYGRNTATHSRRPTHTRPDSTTYLCPLLSSPHNTEPLNLRRLPILSLVLFLVDRYSLVRQPFYDDALPAAVLAARLPGLVSRTLSHRGAVDRSRKDKKEGEKKGDAQSPHSFTLSSSVSTTAGDTRALCGFAPESRFAVPASLLDHPCAAWSEET